MRGLGIFIFIFFLSHVSLIANQTLKFKLVDQYYPLYYKNREGKMFGIIFDLLDKWAQDHNYDISVEAIEYLDQNSIEDDVVYLGLTYNSYLNEYLYFKNEVGKCVTALIYNPSKGQKPSDLFFSSKLRVGVVKNTIYEDILRFHGYVDNVSLFPDTERLLLALRENNIDLVYGSYKSLSCVWYNSFYPYFVSVFNSEYFYSFGIRAAISKNAGIQLRDLDLDLLNYLQSIPKEKYDSFKELDFLFRLDVGIYNDYPPFSFINSKGQFSGILVDLWNALAREYGFSVKFIGFPKESIKRSLDDKDVSIWGGIIEDNNILSSQKYRVIAPICSLDFNLYLTNAKNSNKVINSQIIDFNFNGILLDKNTDIVSNFLDIINRSYGFVENSITTNYLSRLHGYNNILSFRDSSLTKRKSLVLAANNERLQLFTYMLNSLIPNILFDTLLQIGKNWLGQGEIKDYQDNFYGHMNITNFNIEEKIWLQSNRKLNLAVKNWYPIDYFDSGRYKGINERLINKIRRLTNLDFNIVSVPEGEIEELVKLGKIDILSANLDNSNSDYVFNVKAVSEIPLHLFSNKSRLFTSRSSDCIAVLKFLYTKELETQIGTQLVQVDSFKEALDLLYRGKVSGIVSDEYTATINFEDLDIRDIKKILTVPDLTFNVNVAVYNQDHILRRIVQKILFRTNVNNKLYFDDWVFSVHESSKDMRLKKSGIAVLTISMFVFTIFVFFLFNLWKEIGFRKKMYSYAISEKKVIEDAIVAKTIFLASMSHDIRTPINGIIAATELLENTGLLGVQKEYVQMINYSSISLLSLIDDILYISKIDMNGIYIENNEIDLEREIEGIVRSFQSQSAKQNLDLIFYSKSDLESYLIGDRSRLKKVLINLIGNSFKFTADGIIVLNYEVISITEDSNSTKIVIEFKVTDTGKGIKKSNIPRIFELFRQGDDSDARKYEGTGLGLAISRKLVSLMGGPGITVESELGRGTTFSFMLPFVLGNKIQNKELSKLELVTSKKILSLFLSKKTVEVLREISNIFDYRNIHYFYSYEDAYKAYCRYPYYDFIFINVSDSGLHEGLKFAERIDNLNYDVRIVFVFYYLKSDEIIGFKYEYMQKPFKRWDFYSDWIKNGPIVDVPIIGESSSLKIKDNVSILIAEDNEINQRILKDILVVIGIKEDSIDIVDDGAKAIEFLKTKRYDVAFIDIRMSSCDGFMVSKEVRKFESQNNLNPCVLIAVTAHALREYKDRCLENGMNDYLAKPIHISSINCILRKYLHIEIGDNKIMADKKLDGFFDLPNLDVTSALMDLNITYDMYVDLCRGFADISDSLIRDLDEAFNLNNEELIKDLAHSIAGALGNMRSNLFEKFKQIETSTDSINELKILYSKARKDLIILVKNIRERILNVIGADDQKKLKFKSNDEFLVLMRKLLNGIENGNPKEYKKVLNVLKRYRLDGNNIILLDYLIKYLRVYNFKESASIVKRMMNTVKAEKS
ncbi:transporter substrate-binding domain-containing protein [Borrelia anserina]|uniref:histidine kinase n=2 Tax=Borrelia anserina TaxID=143 RepID=W5SML6_BORAN|nr:transporter substrate-binding domain-containing protein [Borrelia anserina]AHH08394.1 Sensory transduction protein kinase [Borrelia anserina BA2]APR64878.1 histidine kinase [Borrelia anserina Es]UPA06800.1 transporter substrate-binding domain-containing protein [Borrelia anserina]